MTPTIAEAIRDLSYWRSMAKTASHGTCAVCHVHHLRAEAAALAFDMAVAWTFSGRHPRGALRREIPG